MGVLADFFLADGATAPRYDGGGRFHASDRCQFKWITPLQAAQFLAVLRSEDYVVGMIREFHLVSPEDADQWTMSVPQDMVERLAEITDDEVATVAARFAGATQEELAWSPDDFVPIVGGLSALTRRALQTGKAMYLWNSL